MIKTHYRFRVCAIFVAFAVSALVGVGVESQEVEPRAVTQHALVAEKEAEVLAQQNYIVVHYGSSFKHIRAAALMENIEEQHGRDGSILFLSGGPVSGFNIYKNGVLLNGEVLPPSADGFILNYLNEIP